MHKRATIAKIAALTLVAAALLGGAATAQGKLHARQGVTQVTFWGDWAGEGQKQFDAMATKFNATHPDIQVKYVVQQDILTKFVTAATSGSSPDVMFWDRWRTALYGPKNVLQPIDDYMARDEVDRNLFYPEALRELTYKGKLYGLPITVDARALFYNKKQFKQAGLKPPRTWAELEKDAVKLTVWKGGKLVRAGFALDDVGLFNMYLQQAGGQMVNADCSKTTFNGPAGRQVLQLWQRLMKDRVYQVGFAQGSGAATDPFVTGKESMLLTGPWNISTYQKYGKQLDFGIVQPPAGPSGKRASVMGGFGLVIPAAAKNKDAAWQFIKWWTANSSSSLYWAQESRNIPGNKLTIQNPYFQKSPFWKPILQTLDYAKIRPPCAGYSPMEVDAVIPTLQLFLEGKLSVNQALSRAQSQGDKVLAQYR